MANKKKKSESRFVGGANDYRFVSREEADAFVNKRKAEIAAYRAMLLAKTPEERAKLREKFEEIMAKIPHIEPEE
ncbi:MAG: hypothetical protein IPO91_11505 [Chloroflexi bacterium]|nr:hypothetical protein [Chloroflexota bacterium]